MARQDVTLRWQFSPDDEQWARVTATTDPADAVPGAAPGRRNWPAVRHLRALAMIGGILVIALALFWLWRQAQTGLEIVEQELAVAIETEIFAEQQKDRRALSARLDPKAEADWRSQMLSRFSPTPDSAPRRISPQIVDFDLKRGEALVEILVTDNALAIPYQETRVYRETADGWIRTAPGATFWGAWESQESAYFTFRYRQRDAESVARAAPALDQIAESIYRTIGLALPGPEEKLAIEVRTAGRLLAGSTQDGLNNDRVLAVHSPLLLPRPVGVAPEAVFIESVMLQVINRIIWERMAGVPGDWQSIRSGLRLWLIWELDGVLARSQPDMVAWLYKTAVSEQRQVGISRPQNYAEICQGFWLWQLHPYELGIPLTCDHTEWQTFARPARMPIRLRELPMPETDPDFRIAWARLHAGRAVGVATVFDYLAEHHGADVVSQVLDSTQIHLSWQKLIPDTIGISPEEFEAQWQAHIRKLGQIQ